MIRQCSPGRPQPKPPLRFALRRLRWAVAGAAALTGLINVLGLTGCFYMLAIYDRVLPEQSVSALAALSLAVVGLHAVYGVLDILRGRVLSRTGGAIQAAFRDRVFAAVQLLPLRLRHVRDPLQPVRDLDQVRAFVSGAGAAALLDLPWVPVYLSAVYLLHPALGLFALGGVVLVVSLALLADARTARAHLAAAKHGALRLNFCDTVGRNAEAARAMGLGAHLQTRWRELSDVHAAGYQAAMDAAGVFAGASKSMRLIVQSGILGCGAFLVIRADISAGIMMAASILMSRALTPIEAASAHWHGFVSTRQSYRRLGALFEALAEEHAGSIEPLRPQKNFAVESLSVVPPGASRSAIRGVSFELLAGDGLAIIGPSGAGKSTLARALVGVWPATGGGVLLDGVGVGLCAPGALGRTIGYLPQDSTLLSGTVAENISRFDGRAARGDVVAAAEAAGAHEMVARLPNGYDTVIGEGGTFLSAGQRRRIALARALFGEPFLVVLDEPSAGLDGKGDAALTEAIRGVRRRAGIVIVIAHRACVLAGVDKVLLLAGGRAMAFGPKEDVLRSAGTSTVRRWRPERARVTRGRCSST